MMIVAAQGVEDELELKIKKYGARKPFIRSRAKGK